MWRCPKCQGTELSVVVEVACNLIQDAGGLFETEEKSNSDHEWGSESPMRCTACSHSSRAGDFELEDDDDEDD